MTIIYKHTCNTVNKYNCLTVKNIALTIVGMNLGERIALARKHAKLTQPALAEKLNGVMTQQNISLLERGITKGTEYIVQIAMACEVRPEWLATGQGEMINASIIYNQQTMAHIAVMQQLPEYAREEVIRDAIKTAELIAKATTEANRKKGTGTSNQ